MVGYVAFFGCFLVFVLIWFGFFVGCFFLSLFGGRWGEEGVGGVRGDIF